MMNNACVILSANISREGSSVITAADGLTALDLARERQPDLIVLDLMLPGLGGLDVCRRLRTFSDAYVIMLTAKAEEIDRIVGLEVGADDYVTRPFSPRELVARVRAMLRRSRRGELRDSDAVPVLRFGDLLIDPARRSIMLGEDEITLTTIEWSLLTTLAAHSDRVWTPAPP
jgi:two-component system, OmpR family, alkaline phosphatase synthesis response regulator PhoP